MVFPLVAGFLVSLLFFFRLMQIQTTVESALFYAGRKTAAQSNFADQQAAELAMAEAYFWKGLEENELIDRYVPRGRMGISLFSSDFSGDFVELQARYYVRLPISFFTIKGISVVQNSKSKKWVGDSCESGREEVWVYVTPYGEVYHTSNKCPYLDLSIAAVNTATVEKERNLNGKRYKSCTYCVDGKGGSLVYVTDYGEAYHWDLSCQGLKRTIEKILLSEVGKKNLCSKCAQR